MTNETLQPTNLLQLVAIKLHKNCGWNHTDGCGWYYEKNWSDHSHADYLRRAAELVDLIKSPNAVADYLQQINEYQLLKTEQQDLEAKLNRVRRQLEKY